MGGLSQSYLILYNVCQSAGWSYLFALLLPHGMRMATGVTESEPGLYRDVELPLKFFQTAAVLEIFHALFGLVKSNPVITAFQVFSRVFITWAVLHSVAEAQLCGGLPLLLLAWTVTEIIRYTYYGFNLLDCHPKVITWMRYTLFIVLYPIGVTGELWCAWVSLAPVRKSGLYTTSLPNTLNATFDFHVVLILIMLAYIPIFPQLYLHMFGQRKKILGGSTKRD